MIVSLWSTILSVPEQYALSSGNLSVEVRLVFAEPPSLDPVENDDPADLSSSISENSIRVSHEGSPPKPYFFATTLLINV